MFIEKCDIQNLSSIGAAYEKHRTTCRSDGACLWHNGLSINISLLTELFTVFFQKTKLLHYSIPVQKLFWKGFLPLPMFLLTRREMFLLAVVL